MSMYSLDISRVPPRNPYSPKPFTGYSSDKPSRTKQAHKDECDINRIMAKYQKTGAIAHLSKYRPAYAELTGESFMEMMHKVKAAETMFDDLPASLRKKFNGNPADFLRFVQNPANLPEMVSLGLAVKTETPVKDDPIVDPVPNP